MKKNKWLKFIAIPVMIMIIASLIYYLYYSVAVNSTAHNIQVIKDHMNSSGVLVDIRNEIAVDSVDDVKLFVTEEEVRIKFGRLILNWTPEEFATKEVQEELNSIGFEVKFKGEPVKMYLYYQGEEVERWVR